MAIVADAYMIFVAGGGLGGGGGGGWVVAGVGWGGGGGGGVSYPPFFVIHPPHQHPTLAGACDCPGRGGPPPAAPLARLAQHEGAALDRHLRLAGQARLQQERLGDDDPLRVADAAHGHVKGFHRDNNVIPMSRKVSTQPAGATACLGSLLPARPRAQSLGGAHAALVIEPALARPRRGPARPWRPRGDGGAG